MCGVHSRSVLMTCSQGVVNTQQKEWVNSAWLCGLAAVGQHSGTAESPHLRLSTEQGGGGTMEVTGPHRTRASVLVTQFPGNSEESVLYGECFEGGWSVNT